MAIDRNRLFSDCVICGRYLSEPDYNDQNVVAAIGPEGTVVCCVDHLSDGPDGPNYKSAINKIAAAKAVQLAMMEVEIER